MKESKLIELLEGRRTRTHSHACTRKAMPAVACWEDYLFVLFQAVISAKHEKYKRQFYLSFSLLFLFFILLFILSAQFFFQLQVFRLKTWGTSSDSLELPPLASAALRTMADGAEAETTADRRDGERGGRLHLAGRRWGRRRRKAPATSKNACFEVRVVINVKIIDIILRNGN